MTRTRVLAYLRVSTSMQAESGLGLEAQRTKIELYAQLYDLEIVEWITDAGASAKSLDREGLQRALLAVRRGQADGLVVAALDRLTRNVRDCADLVERYFTKRASLIVVDMNLDTRSPSSRLVLGLLSQVASWERETVAARTSSAVRAKQARGEFIGGKVPYGYRVEAERVVPVEAEQAVIVEARALRASGMSLRDVAGTLAARGIVTRNGRPFAAQQVARLLGS